MTLDYETLVYTGPVDAFFGHRFGRLPYRSLRFEFETLPRRPVPADRHGQLSRRDRGAVHPDQRVQAPDGPAARRDHDRPRVPAGDRRSVLPDPAAGERRAATSATGRSPTRRPTSTSSGGWRRTSTTTWTRCRPGAGHVPPDQPRPESRGGLTSDGALSRPAVWAGVEPSHLTIAGRRRDQLAETGHAGRLEDIDRARRARRVGRALSGPLGPWRGERPTGRGRRPDSTVWRRSASNRSSGCSITAGVPDGIDPLDRDYPAPVRGLRRRGARPGFPRSERSCRSMSH